jgi:hypothetical protein
MNRGEDQATRGGDDERSERHEATAEMVRQSAEDEQRGDRGDEVRDRRQGQVALRDADRAVVDLVQGIGLADAANTAANESDAARKDTRSGSLNATPRRA